MLYLVKKNKLGYIGRIWKKQIIKISKGKLGVGIITMKVLSILVFALVVWATDINRNTVETLLIEEEMKLQGVENIGDIMNQMPNSISVLAQASPEDWKAILDRVQTSPERFGQLYAVIDTMTYGYHQHFNIIFLVEAMEGLCLILYFRYFYNKNKVSTNLS